MTSNLPTQFILSRKPKQYLKQGLTHCGMYSIKAILSAYEKDIKNHPKEYHTNWIGQHLFSFAIGKRYHEKILEFHGLKAQGGTAKNLSDDEKIALIKTLLSQDNPVMARIGNGYLSCTYSPIIGKVISHWITLWGYDDAKKLFYVYDPGLPKKCWDNTLPVGNTTRTYNEILRDWNFGNKPWHCLSWNTSSEPYLYIQVKSNNAKKDLSIENI
ncbi:MAG: C39 family peptidase [Patescibacteria group bacterium]